MSAKPPRLRLHYYAATCACALLVAACASPSRAPLLRPTSPIVLAAVTWNLDAARGNVPALVDELASGQLTGAVPPDYVLLLQEATEETIVPIARERGLHVFFAAVREINNGRVLGNAILSSRPLTDARSVTLPRERQPRGAAIAGITVDERSWFVVSVHLENRVGLWRRGLIGDAARGRQAEALLAALPADGVGILGGDLNTWLGPSEPAWRQLARRFPDTPADTLQPTFRDRLVLDHLFFDTPDGWRTTRAVVPGRYGSNHHPVLGIITR